MRIIHRITKLWTLKVSNVISFKRFFFLSPFSVPFILAWLSISFFPFLLPFRNIFCSRISASLVCVHFWSVRILMQAKSFFYVFFIVANSERKRNNIFIWRQLNITFLFLGCVGCETKAETNRDLTIIPSKASWLPLTFIPTAIFSSALTRKS